MANEQKLSHADVGAWVFKGNPDKVWDYFSDLADSGRKGGDIGQFTWTLHDTYRTLLIEKGDLVVLWITSKHEAGVWEIGVVNGPLEKDVIDEEYLIDNARKGRQVLLAPFKSLLLEHFIARDDIRDDPDLGGCEQIRIPVMSNPTYLTPEEVEALTQYIPAKALKAAGWTTQLKKLRGKG
jgi:hypothetical protein